ncbi:MAG TPA: hypothetical protein PLM07_19020 [Candidatus Rifleibacterium sp.]|nr:hypothetical protein [Candidatus Rifleibacterium sp.]HPT47978.1 hypothetical protein [Candidatus Rifleibacterium sp.]
MADQPNNKRVYTGLGLLVLLVVANLGVRATRGRPTPAVEVTTPGAASVPVVSTPLQDSRATQPLNVATPLETAGIDEQIIMLNKIAEDLYQRVASMPDPVRQPEFDAAVLRLPLDMTDRFIWEIQSTASVQIASTTDLQLPPPKEIAVLGEFKLGNGSRFLVKENNRVFIIDEGQAPEKGMINLTRGEEGVFTVLDSDGLPHAVRLQKLPETTVEEAKRVLSGAYKDRNIIEIAPQASASEILKTNNEQR